ncbi:HalX domain-containing protein [Streptomyces chrestomyceticus]|nr:hypothetical protein [Streptomyces chrestomyceticus]
MSEEFFVRYTEVQYGSGRARAVSPRGDLGHWSAFVDTCEEGYDDALPDYFYELRIRDAIERALTDERLRQTEGYAAFRARVEAVDERFRRVASERLPVADPSGLGWWHLVVPGRGGEEFARSLREEFGVTVDVVP